MTRLALADELTEIRAEIARLKLREAHLRRLALTAPDQALTGRWNRVEVAVRTTRVFDPALLPDDIRKNPNYSREKAVTAVICRELPIRTNLRPGWPIRREFAGAGMH